MDYAQLSRTKRSSRNNFDVKTNGAATADLTANSDALQ
jgi:hypothetical protein